MKKSNAFINALRGINVTFREERNFRIHLAAAILVFMLGYWLRLTVAEWLWLGLATALVFAAELINTAIESVFDLISPDEHPLTKKAKDAAAGAVLVTAVFALATGVIIFGPKLWSRLL